ncbi:hypothetical protein CEUSTIGMA_g12768.t1 [Chlamydomonas eustigma]|uniref:Cytochrome P450 n=1 Tax=Chlamydomonas eustigma TaxID=1157962 RepID=A0A250XQJ7_9CHLO|nr:hypothetical protein CEUSTIGMA_g12768.t1 [Chlamydomonas eustigma]|eukprot:GAX85351.1 hypothetical protein CEUSTIGMA_g12768.t1 [Chlamydomonas eustigma]
MFIIIYGLYSFITCVIILSIITFFQTKEALRIPGLPLLGNVVALGKYGVAYISKCRSKFGDSFTLSLCGQRMTFLFDPAIIDAFFKSPDSEITFRPAVEQFTQRVFGLPSKEFFPKHAHILRDLRHLLVPSELLGHAMKLTSKFNFLRVSLFLCDGQVELFSAVRSLVFRSAVAVLFGDSLLSIPDGGAEELEHTFFAFEEGFELAASPIPHMFQPGFCTSRQKLLTWLEAACKDPAFRETTCGKLVEMSGLRSTLVPHMLLAVLWASQANTVPATFWSLAMLMLPENKDYAETVLSDVDDIVMKRGDSNNVVLAASTKPCSESSMESSDRLSMEPVLKDEQLSAIAKASFQLATDRRSLISRCVAEAIRLRVHSIDLRMAAQDITLISSSGSKVSLPKGRLMAICPFETHHCSDLFPPEAFRFNPNRQHLVLGDGTAVPPSLSGLAFGGGPYRCPGRFFAEMEVALFVQLILWHVDLTFTNETAVFKEEPGTEHQNNQGTVLPTNLTQERPQAGSTLSKVLHLLIGDEAVVWGLGVFDVAAGETGSKLLQRWINSGDEDGLLPPCNLQRLVGIKVPSEPCYVRAMVRHPKSSL